jgi:hypothetical protein
VKEMNGESSFARLKLFFSHGNQNSLWEFPGRFPSHLRASEKLCHRGAAPCGFRFGTVQVKFGGKSLYF